MPIPQGVYTPEPEKPEKPDEGVSQAGQLAVIEHTSHGTLPTPISWSLSQTGLRLTDLERAARAAARIYDVPQSWVWGDTRLSGLVDPETGEPIDMQTFRRITNNAEPQVLEAMLRQLPNTLTATQEQAVMARREQIPTPVDRKKLAAVIGQMGPLAQYAIPASEGLSAAVLISQRADVKPEDFGRNLKAISDWVSAVGAEEKFGWQEITFMAADAAAQGVALTSVGDVINHYFPNVAQAAETAQTREATIQGMQTQAQSLGVSPTLLYRGYNPKPITAEETEAAKVYDQIVAGTADSKVDLYKLSQDLEKQIVIDQDAFANSWAGKGLGWLGAQLNKPFQYVQEVATAAAAPAAAAMSAVTEAVFPGLQTYKGQGISGPAEAWQDTFDARDEILHRIAGGENIGSVAAETFGLPGWVGTGFDFYLGWMTDPLIVGGKVVMARRAMRVAPELLRTETLAAGIAQKLPILRGLEEASWTECLTEQIGYFRTSVYRLVGSGNAEKLYRAMYVDDEGVSLMREMDRWTTRIEARGGFDAEYMLRLRDEILARFPRDSNEAYEAFRQGLAAHFGFTPPPGTPAALAFAAREARTSTATRSLVEELPVFQGTRYTSSASGLMVPEATAADLATDVIGRVGADFALARRLEVPTRLSFIPGRGLLARTRMAIGESTVLSETVAGRELASLPGINPGTVFKLAENPVRFIGLRGTRWAELTTDELRTFQAEVATAATSPAKIEVLHAMDDLAMERYALRKGIPAAALPEMKKAIGELRGQYEATTRLFGAYPEGEAGVVSNVRRIERPLMETQLAHEIGVVDPILVKKAIRRYASTIKQIEADTPADLLKAIAGLGKFPAFRQSLAVSLGKDVLRTWKFMVVPRPGYVGRVILLDENLRFISTAGGVFERAAATNVEDAVRALSRVITASAMPPKMAAAVGRGAKPLDAILQWLYPERTFQIGDLRVTAVPAGRQAYEAQANVGMRAQDALNDLMRASDTAERYFQTSGSWNVLAPGETAYFDALAHNLNNQLGWSTPGRIALVSVRDGDSIEQTTAKLIAYAQGPGKFMVRNKLGYLPEDVGDWADSLSRVSHSYTMGNPALADAALARAVEPEFLRGFPKGDLPPVHGPLVEHLASGNVGFKKFTNYFYSTFVQQPENALTRQPYYKLWKSRAEKSYLAMAQESGVSYTPELQRAIDAASKRFALSQVKKIMFDFTENTRIGELVSGVFPFVQPFMEAYQVWGHILVDRNPAVIAYVNQLWKAGKESGFIRQDDSGEYVIPTTWWALNAPLIFALAHAPGLATYTPITSMNLFFNTTFRVPTGGVLGMVAGGLPIPIPGTAPWVTWPLQHIFANTRNQAIASWLFQFGPTTKVFPAWADRFFTSAKQEWFDQDAVTAAADDFIRLYQYEGIYQDLSPAKLKEQALSDGQRFMAVRGFISMFQLGQTRISWPFEEVEQEGTDLIAQYGWDKGRDMFIEKYPEYTALMVGKTMFGRGILDPQTGELITTGVRVPSSDYAIRMMNTPGFDTLFRTFPEFAGTIVLDADPKVSEEWSFNASAQLVANGMLEYKPIEEYIRDTESIGRTLPSGEYAKLLAQVTGKEAVPGLRADLAPQGEPTPVDFAAATRRLLAEKPGFWNAIDSFYEWLNGRKQVLEDQGLSTDSVAYAELKDVEGQFLSALRYEFPAISANYLQPEKDEHGAVTGAKWTVPETDSGPQPLVTARLRRFLAIPGIENFPSVVTLTAYFTERDQIADEMARLGISDIQSAGAEETGLTARYNALLYESFGVGKPAEPVEGERLPGEAPVAPEGAMAAYNAFLTNDLRGVPNAAETQVSNMRKNNPERYAKYMEIDTTLEKLRDAAYDVATRPEKNAAYQASRDYIDHVQQTTPWALRLWFNSKSYAEQQSYRDSLMVRTPEFYSRFDWSLLGVKVTNSTASLLSDIGQAQLDITAAKDAARLAGRTIDTGALYDSLDRQIVAHMKTNRNFAEVIGHMNTWGWGAQAAGLDTQGERAGWCWKNILWTVQDLQRQVDQYGYMGVNYGTAEQKRVYALAKAAVLDRVKEYWAWSPEFKAQWAKMQDDYGDPLIDWLVPDDYFKLGG